ncbi:MAG: hypothetical protein JRN15_12260 [Nitrososphaerota archaeon]|nr:hypothetical protein [Nitrososphaerota archaeon]
MKNRTVTQLTTIAFAALFFSIIGQTVALGGVKSGKTAFGTISQIVQTRDGRTSCWGVLIKLQKLHFKDSLAASQLAITEAKHSSDLRSLMVWRVGKSRRTLTVEFKPGMGDFGSGNYMTIRIDSSGIVGSPKSGLQFSISTDLESQRP